MTVSVPLFNRTQEFGSYRDIVAQLHEAYTHGGTSGVREAWGRIVRRHPELIPLVAGNLTKSEGWQVYTLADAFEPRPPLVFVVAGIFSLPSLSVVYGAPGTLKSLLLADMAVCVASGLPWLAPLPDTSSHGRPTQKVPVLWCDFDNGARLTHERFAAVARARTLPITTPINYVSMPSPWLDAYTWDGLQPLMDAVQAQEAKLVIIDNLLAVKGRADENSAEMGRVMAHFRRFTEKMGVATILIHHQRKEIAANSRAGDRVRGHSSIEAALDLALLVERAYQSDLLTIRSTKERGVMVPPFGALFTYEHQVGTVELATAKFFGTEVEDSASDRAIEQAVLAAVNDTPTMIQKDLVAAVKANLPDIGVHRIRAIVKRLEHQQRLQRTQGARTSVRYTVL